MRSKLFFFYKLLAGYNLALATINPHYEEGRLIMVTVNTIATSGVITPEWVKRNEDQVTTHSAWQGDISASASEKFLEGKPAFTYLLRQGDKKHEYYISFVKPDGSFHHQFFALELNKLGWVYRNGYTHGPMKNAPDLIPMMMHCEPYECIPLLRSTS